MPKIASIIKQRGVSLVEIIVTLAIVSILLSIATPSFTALMREIRVSMLAHEVQRGLMLARSEAIKRNDLVRMEAIDGDWTNGWTIQAGETIISTHRLDATKSLSITSKSTDGGTYFGYAGSGRSRTKASAYSAQSGHIRIAIEDTNRHVVINFIGRTRICKIINPDNDTCVSTAN